MLVLNGPGPKPGPAASVDDEGLDSAVETLLRPHLRLLGADPARHAVARAGAGCSPSGRAGWPRRCRTWRCPTSAAPRWPAYLKTLAAEVAADGVTVNMLLPGPDRDRPGRRSSTRPRPNGKAAAVDGGRRRESQATIPAGRYGDPAEFGAVGGVPVQRPAVLRDRHGGARRRRPRPLALTTLPSLLKETLS